MSVWSLAAAAVLVGAPAGLHRQPAQAGAVPAPAVEVQAEQRVSADFQHASVADVMDWLTKNGANFVAADSELPKDATITLNAKDVPMRELLDAIASALGGHWERQGNMRVFRKGAGFRVLEGNRAFGEDGDSNLHFMTPDSGSMKVFSDDGKNFQFVTPDKGQFKVFRGDGKTFVMPDGKNWSMPDMENLKARLKDLPMNGWSEETQKQVEEAMRAAQKAWEESGEQQKVSEKAMEDAERAQEKSRLDPEQRKEIEKAMEDARKAMEGNGDEMRAARKAMEQARQEMEKARKEHPEMFRNFSGDNGKFFVKPGQGNQFFYTAPGNGNFKAPRVWINRSGDLKNFVNSLSEEQREKNRRQGYLNASDLTANQLKMLGIDSDSKNWSITIKQDGESVTVKSER